MGLPGQPGTPSSCSQRGAPDCGRLPVPRGPAAGGSVDLANLLNQRRMNDSVGRMSEFETHPPANKAHLQHGTAPGLAMDVYQDGARAKLRVPGDQRLAVASVFEQIMAVLCLHLQQRARRKVVQENTAFN